MKKLITATHILASLFVGMIIGGFAFGNTGMGIAGIVLLVIDIIVGIALQYQLEKPYRSITQSHIDEHKDKDIYSQAYTEFSKEMERGKNLVEKINLITSNHIYSTEFSVKELADGIVNIQDAQKNLSTLEYLNFMKIYNYYKNSQKQMTLNYEKFLSVCNDIISNYDLAAPYHKYCGYESMFAEFVENEKKPYRNKARILLNQNLQFSQSWNVLNSEFKQKFYE